MSEFDLKSIGDKTDKEDDKVAINAPNLSRAVPFIVGNVFLERYCTAGVLAILPLFLHRKLDLTTNLSTSLFHVYEGLTLLFTIAGALLADMWLGLYKSILIMSFVYVCGLVIISIGLIEPLNLPLEVLVIIGLSITVVGCGCIKGNTNVFGANQHKMPEQERQLQIYFSSQYFALKCGSLLARFSFPMIKEDVKCFGSDDCYALTFGIAATFVLLALIVLTFGNSHYRHVPSHGNMLLKVANCIKHAVLEKRKQQKFNNEESVKKHWLSYSQEKYGRKLVLETKVLLKVLMIFIPIPMFWALHMQQSSRFIFQATRMNGDLGFYTIKADQMIVLNSVLVLFLIPFFERIGYKWLEKIGIKTMLDRMIIGNCCTIIAFGMAAVVEMQVEKNLISILWQIPQFFVLAIAEIFTYLSHLNFTYKEAPVSMKPVMVALMYLSIASGDFIVAIISGVSFFNSQVYEYIFFASLMVLDVILLSFLAHRYKYTDHEMIKDLDDNKDAH